MRMPARLYKAVMRKGGSMWVRKVLQEALK